MTRRKQVRPLLDAAARVAGGIIGEGRDHVPTLLLYAHDPGEWRAIRVVQFQMPPPDAGGARAVLADRLADVVRGSDAYVMIYEAWGVMGAATRAVVTAGVRPTDHPERREVLCLHFVSRDGPALFRVHGIVRDPDVAPRLARPVDFDEVGDVTTMGMFSDLYARGRVPPGTTTH